MSVVMLLSLLLTTCASPGQAPNPTARFETAVAIVAAASAAASTAYPSDTPTAPRAVSPETSAPIIRLVGVERKDVTNGWVTYRALFSVYNPGLGSVQFGSKAPSLEATPLPQALPFYNLSTGGSQVETDEGHTYPVEQAGVWGQPVIPGGLEVTDVMYVDSDFLNPRPGLVYFSYRVPELLHPARLRVTPGLSMLGAQPDEMIFDLNALPETDPPRIRIEALPPLPESVQLSQAVMLSTSPIAETTVDYQKGALVFELRFTVQNADITADQPVNFYVQLTDAWGRTSWRKYAGGSLGPAQSSDLSETFMRPALDAIRSPWIAVTLITESTDKTYILPLPEPANCWQAESLPESMQMVYTDPILEAQELTVPGQGHGTLGAHGWKRFDLQLTAGQLLSVAVTPQSTTTWPYKYRMLVLADPAGNTAFSGAPDDYGTVPDTSRIPIYCNGIFHLYMWQGELEGFAGEYTVSVEVH